MWGPRRSARCSARASEASASASATSWPRSRRVPRSCGHASACPGTDPAAAAVLVDQLARHGVNRNAPEGKAEDDESAQTREVAPALEAEGGVADELHAVVERVELASNLRPFRELAQREERARHEEERREDRADDVVE